jgi:hypothetical protein
LARQNPAAARECAMQHYRILTDSCPKENPEKH